MPFRAFGDSNGLYIPAPRLFSPGLNALPGIRGFQQEATPLRSLDPRHVLMPFRAFGDSNAVQDLNERAQEMAS